MTDDRRPCPYCKHNVRVADGRFVEHYPNPTDKTPIWAMTLACPGSDEKPEADR